LQWSLQSHGPSTSSTSNAQPKDFWTSNNNNASNKLKSDPMQLLFGNTNTNNSNNNAMIDSGITSPHSQSHTEDDFHVSIQKQ